MKAQERLHTDEHHKHHTPQRCALPLKGFRRPKLSEVKWGAEFYLEVADRKRTSGLKHIWLQMVPMTKPTRYDINKRVGDTAFDVDERLKKVCKEALENTRSAVRKGYLWLKEEENES